MKGYKEKTFSDRLSEAATARQSALERFRSRPSADDPDVVKRREERLAMVQAREARAAERKVAKEAEAAARAEREAIEKIEREARERREAVEKLIRDRPRPQSARRIAMPGTRPGRPARARNEPTRGRPGASSAPTPRGSRPCSVPGAQSIPPGARIDADDMVAVEDLHRLAQPVGRGAGAHDARLSPVARAVAICGRDPTGSAHGSSSTGCQVAGSIERPPQPYSTMKSLGVRA